MASVTLTDERKLIIIHNHNEDRSIDEENFNIFVHCAITVRHTSIIVFQGMEKPREQTECRSIYYQIWHDAMICGTGLMLVKTRRGVSRI